MVTLIVCCKEHGQPVEFRVHEDTAEAAYICLDCGAQVLFRIRAMPSPKPAPAPVTASNT